jgi:hypothetical protein
MPPIPKKATSGLAAKAAAAYQQHTKEKAAAKAERRAATAAAADTSSRATASVSPSSLGSVEIEKKPRLVHAFDIETAGSGLGFHSLLSIGFAGILIDGETGEVLDDDVARFKVNIAPKDGATNHVWEPRCRIEFWDKNPEALRLATKDPKPAAVAAALVRDHVYDLQRRAAQEGWVYTLVTDNAYFDPSWIDHFVSTTLGEPFRLAHNVVTGYMGDHQRIDVDSRIQALIDDLCLTKEVVMQGFAPCVTHDHDAINDALYIAYKYAHYIKRTDILGHVLQSAMQLADDVAVFENGGWDEENTDSDDPHT